MSSHTLLLQTANTRTLIIPKTANDNDENLRTHDELT
jgi:hypothetical protein